MLVPSRGFNILSILITIAILALVAWLVLISYANVRANALLKNGVEQVLSTLTATRAKTLAGIDNAQYGVYLQSDRLVVFRGSAYPGTTVETVMLDSAVTIPTITLSGGGSSVVFARLTGATGQAGTLVMRLVSDPSKQKTITILATGAAYAQ